MIDPVIMPVPAKHYGDIAAKQKVEIQVRQDGLVIWINVDSICVARIITNGFLPIKIEDNRK